MPDRNRYRPATLRRGGAACRTRAKPDRTVFIKQRKIRRSTRFQPRWTRGTRREGDYLVSVYSMAVVQAVLFVFLLVGAWRAFTAMRSKLEDLGWYFSYGIPLAMAAIAVFVLKLLIDSIRQAVEIHKTPPGE